MRSIKRIQLKLVVGKYFEYNNEFPLSPDSNVLNFDYHMRTGTIKTLFLKEKKEFKWVKKWKHYLHEKIKTTYANYQIVTLVYL